MKGSSTVIMGATMAIVIVLGIVLALVLVLLAQLYYSLLFRNPNLDNLSDPSSSAEDHNTRSVFRPRNQAFPSPLATFYAHGVLHAPLNFLFPKENDEKEDDIEKQKHAKLHQVGVTSLSSSSPSPCYMSAVMEPNQPTHNHDQVESDEGELMYISNPIYDNHEGGLGLGLGLGPSPAVVGGSSSCPGSLPLSPIEELAGSRDVARSMGT